MLVDFDTMFMAFATKENRIDEIVDEICGQGPDVDEIEIDVDAENFDISDLREIRNRVYKRTGKAITFK